jgi:hypothetical protein
VAGVRLSAASGINTANKAGLRKDMAVRNPKFGNRNPKGMQEA